MLRSWRSGDCTMSIDETGVTFDTVGTPLDMQWHCSFGELVRRVDELRASWSEAVLRELFAEAARLAPSEVPPAPPAPMLREPPPPRTKATRRRRRPERERTPVETPHAATLAGFGQGALEALRARAAAAAAIVDASFPAELPGPLVQAGRDVSLEQEIATYRTENAPPGIVVTVRSEIQDGVGGPVAVPVSASVSAVGLAAGASVEGTWNGREVEAKVTGPPSTVGPAVLALRDGPGDIRTP